MILWRNVSVTVSHNYTCFLVALLKISVSVVSPSTDCSLFSLTGNSGTRKEYIAVGVEQSSPTDSYCTFGKVAAHSPIYYQCDDVRVQLYLATWPTDDDGNLHVRRRWRSIRAVSQSCVIMTGSHWRRSRSRQKSSSTFCRQHARQKIDGDNSTLSTVTFCRLKLRRHCGQDLRLQKRFCLAQWSSERFQQKSASMYRDSNAVRSVIMSKHVWCPSALALWRHGRIRHLSYLQ